MEGKIPKHVHWDYYNMGTDSTISGDEANKIIEEILEILKSHNVTVKVAKELLNDTISSIDNEVLVK